MGKLIINGNQVYELDEACMKQKEKERKQQEEQLRKREKNRVFEYGSETGNRW
ncbi:MAG: hypothetical protein ACI4DO_01855 [Roseburia sp.]